MPPKKVLNDSDSEDDEKNKGNFVDNEASESENESGSGRGSGEDSEDDGSDQDEFEKDGFVVDDDEDEDEIEEEDKKKRKKKHRKFRKAKKIRIDEEDIQLVEESRKRNDSFVEDDGEDSDELIHDEEDEEDEEGETRGRRRIVTNEEEDDLEYKAIFHYDESLFDVGGDYDDDEEKELQADDNEQKDRNDKIESNFEFATQAENYLLPSDRVIATTRIPERTQLLEKRMSLKRTEDNHAEFYLSLAIDTDSRDDAEIAEIEGDYTNALALTGEKSSAEQKITKAREAQAAWVLYQLQQTYIARDVEFRVGVTLECVQNALGLMQRHDLEVPFIHLHRREDVNPLCLEDLWTIRDLSFRYLKVLKLKQAVRQLISEAIPPEVMDDETYFGAGQLGAKSLQSTLLDRLDNVEPEKLEMDQLHDLKAFVVFRYGNPARQLGEGGASQEADTGNIDEPFQDDDDDEGNSDDESAHIKALKKKRKAAEEALRKRKDISSQRRLKQRAIQQKPNYLTLKEYNLQAFCDAIVNIQRFGASVVMGTPIFAVSAFDKPGEDPISMATIAIGDELSTTDIVAQVASDNVSLELMLEPRVKAYLRDLVKTSGKVTTRLTVKGRQAIASDPLHDYYAVSNITDKPYSAFLAKSDDPKRDYRTQVLMIRRAEKDGFITKKSNRAELTLAIFLTMSRYLLTEEGAERVKIGTVLEESSNRELKIKFPSADIFEDWDKIRFNMLKSAVINRMIPYMEGYMFSRLAKEAENHVVRLCTEKVWKVATTAPAELCTMKGNQVKIPNHYYVSASRCRIMAVYLSDDMKATNYAAVIDDAGFVLDYVALPAIVKREAIESRVDEMIDKLSPHIVALNGSVGMRVRGIYVGLEKRAIKNIENDPGPPHGAYESHEETAAKNPSQIFIPLIVDDTLASVIGGGAVMKKEFPDYHIHLKKAISLARCLKDPLAQLCAIWTDYSRQDSTSILRSEMLTWNVHPLQAEVSPMMLLNSIERALVMATAIRGVDVNLVAKAQHMATTLPFVPGLGFRKALDLVRAIERAGHTMFSRQTLSTLLSEHPGTDNDHGDIHGDDEDDPINMNAIGFLLAQDRHIDILAEHVAWDDAELFKALDRSRITPELNRVAAYMCWKVKYGDKKAMPSIDDDGSLPTEVNKCILKVMRACRKDVDHLIRTDPDWRHNFSRTMWFPFGDMETSKTITVDGETILSSFGPFSSGAVEPDRVASTGLLETLNMQEVLEELSVVQQAFLRMGRITLQKLSFCRNELQFPNAPCCIPRGPPTSDELFDLLTGESDESIRPGTDVMVKITRVRGNWIEVRLSCGLTGSIYVTELSDERVPDRVLRRRPDDVVDERDSVEKWMQDVCGLSVGSDVAARILEVYKEKFSCKLTAKVSILDRLPHLQIDDKYWRRPETAEERAESRKGHGRTSDGVLKRPISHPLYQNVTRAEAEEFLQDKPVGECVVRPSSQGLMYLTVTWKVTGAPAPIYQHFLITESGKKQNDPKIGPLLKIKDLEFEDLDEMIERYLSPVADFAKDIQKYKYFKNVSKDVIQNECVRTKAKEPKRIPYFIIPNEEHPGYFVLHYQPGSTVRKVGISVTPDGFKLQTHVNGKPADVVNNIEMLIEYFKKNFAKFGPPAGSRYGGGGGSSSRGGDRYGDRYGSGSDRYGSSSSGDRSYGGGDRYGDRNDRYGDDDRYYDRGGRHGRDDGYDDRRY